MTTCTSGGKGRLVAVHEGTYSLVSGNCGSVPPVLTCGSLPGKGPVATGCWLRWRPGEARWRGSARAAPPRLCGRRRSQECPDSSPAPGRSSVTRSVPPSTGCCAAAQLAQGPEVAQFEREFAAHFALGRACVAVSSGTSGLHVGLLASGVRRGRRGDRPVVHLRGHRQRGGPRGSQAGVRRHLGAGLLPRCLGRRGRRHRADRRHHAGAPVRPSRRPAVPAGGGGSARPAGLRGRRPGARGVAARRTGRGVRHVRGVLAVPDQEHDQW